jgi:hypothetical protein
VVGRKKENDGGGEVNYDILTIVSFTMYPYPEKLKERKGTLSF